MLKSIAYMIVSTAIALTAGLILFVVVGHVALGAETRMRVAVIDTGLDLYDYRFRDVLCEDGHRDFTATGLYDHESHGTHVAGIIAKNAPDHLGYCLVILKVYDPKMPTKYVPDAVIEAIRYTKDLKAQIVNISFSGNVYSESEKKALESSPAQFSIAAGNDGEDYHKYYPGGYNLKNVHAVGNWDCNTHKKSPQSNYGEGIIWQCGTKILSTLPGNSMGFKTGTSQAAPLYTAQLINQRTGG